jgi:hypothetical protein
VWFHEEGCVKQQVVVSIVLCFSLSLSCCSLSLRYVRFSWGIIRCASGFTLDVDPPSVESEFMSKYVAAFGDERAKVHRGGVGNTIYKYVCLVIVFR